MWNCEQCGEKIEDSFDVCWNCGTAMDGSKDPEFVKVRDVDESRTVQATSDAKLVSMPTSCSHCGGVELYTRRVSSGGSDGPYFLTGLGHFMHYAQFDVVICGQCGLTQFFAEPSARGQLESHEQWVRIQSPGQGDEEKD